MKCKNVKIGGSRIPGCLSKFGILTGACIPELGPAPGA